MRLPDDEKYPEHVKMHAVKDMSQPIGEFLDWLLNSGYEICRHRSIQDDYIPTAKTVNAWLAEMFNIDLHKLEQEKETMLTAQRASNMVHDLKSEQPQ